MSDSISISGAANIEMTRVLTVRAALKLECKGLTRSGRSANQLANDILGTSTRSKKVTYAALNKYIVSELGTEFDRPL